MRHGDEASRFTTEAPSPHGYMEGAEAAARHPQSLKPDKVPQKSVPRWAGRAGAERKKRRKTASKPARKNENQTRDFLRLVVGCFRARWIPPKNVGTIHHQQGWAKHFLEETAKAVQPETDSSWQHGSPFKEELQLLRMGNDLRLEGSFTRQAKKAGKACEWAEFLNKDRLNASITRMLQGGGARRRGSEGPFATDLAEEHVLPEADHGAVTLSYVCPHCHRYPLEDHIWWVSWEHESPVRKRMGDATGGVRSIMVLLA